MLCKFDWYIYPIYPIYIKLLILCKIMILFFIFIFIFIVLCWHRRDLYVSSNEQWCLFAKTLHRRCRQHMLWRYNEYSSAMDLRGKCSCVYWCIISLKVGKRLQMRLKYPRTDLKFVWFYRTVGGRILFADCVY